MFTFRAWKPASVVGEPGVIADTFARMNVELWQGNDDLPDIRFEIVDLRPGDYAPDVVEELVKRLAEMLLGSQKSRSTFTANSRLLFVGAARTLATREDEASGNRAIKHDVEFYIRTLQNYDVAHYAGIGKGDVASQDAAQSIRSALIGMSRHYRDKRREAACVEIGERLALVKADFANLVASARNLPEFRYLGSCDDPKIGENRIDYLWLLREIGLIYQFGKGDRPKGYSPSAVLAGLRERKELTFAALDEHSSYSIYTGMLGEMGRWAEEFHMSAVSAEADPGVSSSEQLAAADRVAKHSFKLSRYELLRDFGRVIGQGALQRFREMDRERPLLMIDDEIYGMLSMDGGRGSHFHVTRQHPILQLISHALASAGRHPASLHVVPSGFVDSHIGMMQANSMSALIGPVGSPPALDLRGIQADDPVNLEDYLAILIDPESRTDSCGPVRVQRLHSFIRHRLEAPQARATGESKYRYLPPILAVSRKESSGYVQQCLNMGASAFVPKTRPFQLLFALARALRDERRQHRPDGQASQFRILKTLKPHVGAKLLRKSGPSFIHGGLTLPSGSHVEDPREARWIRNLPKADLHYHFGTAIPCDTVAVMAMNTAGYFLGETDCPSDAKADGGATPLLRRLARALALTARLERLCLSADPKIGFSRMELLAAATEGVISKGLKNEKFGLGDAIVSHLLDPNDRCDAAHGTALLVAMMASREDFGPDNALKRFLQELARPDAGPDGDKKIFSSERALRFEMERAREHFQRVACRWKGSFTAPDFEALSVTEGAVFWGELGSAIGRRVASANARLRSCLDRALADVEQDDEAWKRAVKWLSANSSTLQPEKITEPQEIDLPKLFTIDEYVAVPAIEQGRGLQLYLRGADLLGSSHLQYPENLWMAALAITLDNAEQNIIYSEVRCETTGYAKAGMGAHDATEILRHGFNLASLYVSGIANPENSRQCFPLVRTNILLAAKRHKSEPEARAVVNLLETYLERRASHADAARSRRAYSDRFGTTMPPWWRPCDVVGFDLSGDESRDRDWLKTVIVPLAARSSPVTIHAGEAASADSIWRAVYELNALRIGHGLRLNEDLALLGYCVREGICMELCPNSNRYTNMFDPQSRRDVNAKSPATSLRYEYPLLHYLSQGMEVTLGTDNRYLHRPGQRTLTSEYLTAAELVGGITRWEALQIVKAGFKNAFLDKSEVHALIAAAENEIYRIVATDFE